MRRTSLHILVAWFVLVSSPLAVLAQQIHDNPPRLGPAPTFPKDLAGLEAGGGAAVVSQPTVTALAVTPADRDASRAFFITYYQNAAAPPDAWSGTRTSCDDRHASDVTVVGSVPTP